jgi:hypothetical protein
LSLSLSLSSLVTRRSSLVTRHSSLVTRHSFFEYETNRITSKAKARVGSTCVLIAILFVLLVEESVVILVGSIAIDEVMEAQ